MDAAAAGAADVSWVMSYSFAVETDQPQQFSAPKVVSLDSTPACAWSVIRVTRSVTSATVAPSVSPTYRNATRARLITGATLRAISDARS